MILNFLALVSLFNPQSAVSTNEFSTATEMYLYSWPLVMTRLTRKSMFYCPDNRMMPLPVFPNPNLTAIVRPNVDTLYDACWIDHTKADDLVLTIPNTEEGLYFLFPLMVCFCLSCLFSFLFHNSQLTLL